MMTIDDIKPTIALIPLSTKLCDVEFKKKKTKNSNRFSRGNTNAHRRRKDNTDTWRRKRFFCQKEKIESAHWSNPTMNLNNYLNICPIKKAKNDKPLGHILAIFAQFERSVIVTFKTKSVSLFRHIFTIRTYLHHH